MFPYPSASGLHVGHWKGYVFSDLYARRKFLEGYNVLHPMGWDAFGLPAENDAIKKKIHPAINTQKNIDCFKVQLKKIGAIYDWSKEVNTTDPNYYKWTQWIFTKMFEQGLAYEETVPVNWCPKCLTGLANEEASGGVCDRCGTAVEQKPLRQWVLKITAFAEDLYNDLDELAWPEKVKLMQKHWIGKSTGTEVFFKIKNSDKIIKTFTTRVDTLAGCSFVVLAPDHELVQELITESEKENVSSFLEKFKYLTEKDRMMEKEKHGVFTGSYAVNPLTNEALPIFLANYVLKSYGSGAVMGVPAHDQRDFEFAQKFGLKLTFVIKPATGSIDDSKAYEEAGILFNAGQFDGLNSEDAKSVIADYLEKQKNGMKITYYKMRDWIFSRQRYWGEPIPLIHCSDCGTVPVPEHELPLRLPEVEEYEPSGTGESPLAKIEAWVNTDCPKCKKAAKRETNTMPQWAGSCWYFLRYTSPDCGVSLADKDAIKYWMPVDLYVGGIEHAVLHLLYSRFYIKFLHKIGVVDFKEPFSKLFNQGMVCMKSPTSGRVEKMSKSKGNVVNPDEIVDQLGSDCLRMYMLFMGPPELDTEWQTESIKGVFNFLTRLWAFVSNKENIEEKASIDSQKRFHSFLKNFKDRLDEYKVNTAVSAIMEYLNDMQRQRLKFDKTILAQFLTAISIMVPHFSSELLEAVLGIQLENQIWPTVDESLAAKNSIEIAVQVNGKLKSVLHVDISMSKEEIIELAKKALPSFFDFNSIKKTIYVPGKIVSFVC